MLWPSLIERDWPGAMMLSEVNAGRDSRLEAALRRPILI
jgi:hypothetical protein